MRRIIILIFTGITLFSLAGCDGGTLPQSTAQQGSDTPSQSIGMTPTFEASTSECGFLFSYLFTVGRVDCELGTVAGTLGEMIEGPVDSQGPPVGASLVVGKLAGDPPVIHGNRVQIRNISDFIVGATGRISLSRELNSAITTHYAGYSDTYFSLAALTYFSMGGTVEPHHVVAVTVHGTAVSDGNNDYGQGDLSDWTDITAASAGGIHTLGLKRDGTVVAAGGDFFGQCGVSEWTDIVAIVAGGQHSVGLRADGTVVAVGLNNHGQCDVSDWTDIVEISAGRTSTTGIKADGTVLTTGK